MSAEIAEIAGRKSDREAVREIAVRRLRVSLLLTAILLVIYLGFMLLVAFDKDWLATQLTDGLSLALVLGAVTIVAAWVLALVYVSWANRHHDAACDLLDRGRN